MQTIVLFFGVLVALIVLTPLVRRAIAIVAADGIAKRALARIPDAIHLVRSDTNAWKDAVVAKQLATALAKRGFEDTGTYKVPELPGVVLELMLHPSENILGVIHEHPNAGYWVELMLVYTDGTSLHVTSSRETGLAELPGHRMVHLPGTTPDILHKRLTSARGQAETEALDPQQAAERYESFYTEAVTWRKSKGVSRSEVASVAAREVA